MIDLKSALRLKQAGLEWLPALNDFFAIPDREMDERVFVISDMLSTLEFRSGLPIVAFQGASEWALDNLILEEIVWLPREEQLRAFLESALIQSGRPELRLDCGLNGYSCKMVWNGQSQSFHARRAELAYAEALLFILGSQSND